MAGFTQFPNYDFLEGVELTQVRVNQYTVDFDFTEGPMITTVASEFDHFDQKANTTSKYEVDGTTKEFTVHWLLGLRTTKARAGSDDELTLTFENGDTLTFIRRNDGYESMVIHKDRLDWAAIM